MSPYLVHQELQVFLRHPGHLSHPEDPEVQSQGPLVDLCLLEYLGHLAHQGDHVLLSLAESPVECMFVIKCMVDRWIDQSKRWTDSVRATYRSSFGSRRSRLSLATRTSVQTGQTRWSREASITLLSPHAAHCDSIAWVSLLSRESWSSLRAGGTLEGGSRKEKVADSI